MSKDKGNCPWNRCFQGHHHIHKPHPDQDHLNIWCTWCLLMIIYGPVCLKVCFDQWLSMAASVPFCLYGDILWDNQQPIAHIWISQSLCKKTVRVNLPLSTQIFIISTSMVIPQSRKHQHPNAVKMQTVRFLFLILKVTLHLCGCIVVHTCTACLSFRSLICCVTSVTITVTSIQVQ